MTQPQALGKIAKLLQGDSQTREITCYKGVAIAPNLMKSREMEVIPLETWRCCEMIQNS